MNADGDADGGLPAERSPHPDARPNGRTKLPGCVSKLRRRGRGNATSTNRVILREGKAITFCMSFQTIRLISRFPSFRTR